MGKRKEPLAEYTTGDYWQAHLELIRTLFVLDIDWPLDQRVDTFWLRLRLSKVPTEDGGEPDPEVVQQAIDLLDLMVALRLEGVEPYHEGDRYVT